MNRRRGVAGLLITPWWDSHGMTRPIPAATQGPKSHLHDHFFPNARRRLSHQNLHLLLVVLWLSARTENKGVHFPILWSFLFSCIGPKEFFVSELSLCDGHACIILPLRLRIRLLFNATAWITHPWAHTRRASEKKKNREKKALSRCSRSFTRDFHWHC